MFGYLDLYADTQWIRVMPVRNDLFLTPEPIDAVVTLEHLESGRVVTLSDSLIGFRDDQLGTVAYAYNFWTTEPLEPRAAYRLRAERSDGASSSALVAIPDQMEITFRNDILNARGDFGTVRVRSKNVLYVDVLFMLQVACGAIGGGVLIHPERQRTRLLTGDSITHEFGVRADQFRRECFADLNREEILVVTAPTDWPYHSGISDLEAALPGIMPSNVDSGVGFVGGVATWTIPFHRCEVRIPKPGGGRACELGYNARSASVVGRVKREPCGSPEALMDVRLLEDFAGGGAITLHWTTGLRGEYRFEGIEPGARLVLDVPGKPALTLPALAPGQRYRVDDVTSPASC